MTHAPDAVRANHAGEFIRPDEQGAMTHAPDAVRANHAREFFRRYSPMP